jgi:spore germination protein GerM
VAKKLVIALMLSVALVAAVLGIRTFFKKNETVAYNKHYVWYAETGSDGAAGSLVRGRHVDQIRKDVAKLVAAFNRSTEELEAGRAQGDGNKADLPKLVLRAVEQQSANVEVLNDRYLAESMGSSGAQDYLAEATFTLTEHPGVKSVTFQFNGGDHAMPGTYSRENFPNYALVNEAKAR